MKLSFSMTPYLNICPILNILEMLVFQFNARCSTLLNALVLVLDNLKFGNSRARSMLDFFDARCTTTSYVCSYLFFTPEKKVNSQGICKK